MLDSEVFDPDVVDASGNTLFHLVAFGKCSRRKCDIVRVLADAGANPTLKNTDGKVPVDYLTKNYLCISSLDVISVSLSPTIAAKKEFNNNEVIL